MSRLTTTPHKFMWQVKNPEEYWSDTLKDSKYIVFVNKCKKGNFCGVNRTFNDDIYYVNFWDENGKFDYCSVHRDIEMILEPIGGVI